MGCQINGNGKLRLLLNNNYILELNNIIYVPEFKRNLISSGELDDQYNILIHKGLVKLNHENQEVISFPKINGIYTIYAEPIVSHNSAAVNSTL